MSGRVGQVQDKSAAKTQITAEQILREAWERQDVGIKAPKQKISDKDELLHYRLRKRKEYEDVLRRARSNIGVWLKYATWEAEQLEFDRSRSVFERVLDIDYRNVAVWIKYAEMEMKNRFVNRARNVLDRAVSLLPRVDQFWYKFVHMEEMLGNIAECRAVFERWMGWAPARNSWLSYVKMELRHGSGPKTMERIRHILERYLLCHADVEAYLEYAKIEMKNGEIAKARCIYERCSVELAEDIILNDDKLFTAFASFEEHCNEYDRARAIYTFALERLSKARSRRLYSSYTAFEKQHGARQQIDDVIIAKRRAQYEQRVAANKHDFDAWHDFLRLEISAADPENFNLGFDKDNSTDSFSISVESRDRLRDLFERAVSCVPPVPEKRLWLRYIYIWVKYLAHEEVVNGDIDRCRALYRTVLRLIPHRRFTFVKMWRGAAELEIRAHNLDAARRILGQALGVCGPDKTIDGEHNERYLSRLFNAYIELELQLGAVERCRTLYHRYVTSVPASADAWTGFAGLEASLGEDDRARALFELAVSQTELDAPEKVWKAYLAFEAENGAASEVRILYERLLERTKHVKVWTSWAQFEASIDELDRARGVFEQADRHYKGDKLSDERVLLLEAWREFESTFGDASTQDNVLKRLPKRVKKRRLLTDESGGEAGWEEYIDYEFPDQKKGQANHALLAMARQWKKQRVEADSDDESDDDDDDDNDNDDDDDNV